MNLHNKSYEKMERNKSIKVDPINSSFGVMIGFLFDLSQLFNKY